ncbi:hypothetical protein Tco_0025429 [Tanacetum coccineum]
MEDDFKPVIQHQRRVNPKIHEVIKKEVIKLLDAGLIYPISDSPWVSPVHCVPKKGGMTVVENEDNELILGSGLTYKNDHPNHPKTMQEAIEMATELMDRRINTVAERQAESKRKFEDTPRNNQNPQQNKRQNTGRAMLAGNGDKELE